jgi:DNA-binding transcriptional ArsR family regulator
MKNPTPVFKAIADPTRRQILQALKEKEMCAGEIVEMFTISGPSVSRHLSVLKDAGLINERRDGTSIIYSLNAENLALCLSEFISSVCPTEMIEREKRKKDKS